LSGELMRKTKPLLVIVMDNCDSRSGIGRAIYCHFWSIVLAVNERNVHKFGHA
jgi:hypothetical protein